VASRNSARLTTITEEEEHARALTGGAAPRGRRRVVGAAPQLFHSHPLAACPTLRLVGSLVREFGRLTRIRAVAVLDDWLVQAEGGGIAEFVVGAASPHQDHVTVVAVPTESWGSGQTGGRVTRPKLPKRHRAVVARAATFIVAVVWCHYGTARTYMRMGDERR